MSIYEKPVRVIIKDMIAELAPSHGVSFTRHDAIDWFAAKYPKVKLGTITAHLYRFSTNSQSRLSHPTKPDEDILFQIDKTNFRLYNSDIDALPIHNDSNVITSLSIEDSMQETTVDSDQLNEFAYERDLKNFLVKNLNVIESGLRLYQDEDINGVEFPVDGRFIDILALDKVNNLVVIELKVSRGHERVVGQLLRYMAWIQQNQAENNQKVRGVIVAREITDDLKLACSYTPQVSLFEYELSVKLKLIEMDYLSN